MNVIQGQIPEGMNMKGMQNQMKGMNMRGMQNQMKGMNMKGMQNQMKGMNMKGMQNQMGQMPEGMDKLKDIMKIFDIFKPNNLNEFISKLRNINRIKFDAIEELKDIEKKKKFDLVKLKYVAKFVNSLEEKDIHIFIKSLAPLPKQSTKNIPLNSMDLGNSMNLDIYTIKDITSIFIDINDEMYKLIQDLVNDQIKLVKKAQNQGNMSEGIDVRLIPKLLNILDQLTMANLDKIINIATTKFGIVIPVRGFQIKVLVKSLKIVFPLKNQAKLTSNVKNDMRYLVSANNLSNKNKGALDQFKRKLRSKDFINLLSTPLLKYDQITDTLKENKNISLLIILLINSFYLTHNIKLFDIDKIKNIYAIERKRKPNIQLEDVKKDLKNKIIIIYRNFIYTKGFIILLSKLALNYYYHTKDNMKFFNILFHIIYSFNESNEKLNIYHPNFDYELYINYIKNPDFVENYNLESNFENVCKRIFNVSSINDLSNHIYEIFKKNKSKSSILELNHMKSYKDFNHFFTNIMEKKYVVYIFNNEVSTLRLNKNINITKPLYFSLHELSLSEYNRVNKFILRSNLNQTKNILNENNINNSNSNVQYTKEELNSLIQIIKKKMYNNDEINKIIRNKNKSIYNSFELIDKVKDLYKFEAFILILFKSQYTNIFHLLTEQLDPLAKEALTKI